jgi:hypothetical protein
VDEAEHEAIEKMSRVDSYYKSQLLGGRTSAKILARNLHPVPSTLNVTNTTQLVID